MTKHLTVNRKMEVYGLTVFVLLMIAGSIIGLASMDTVTWKKAWRDCYLRTQDSRSLFEEDYRTMEIYCVHRVGGSTELVRGRP